MTDFWPKDLSPKYFDAADREAIKFHEELRQLTERVIKLEAKK